MRAIVWVALAVVLVAQQAEAGRKTNGACGSANGAPTASVPTANLCAVGSAGAVSGAGPWSWVCNGSGNGHKNAKCAAPRMQAPPPPPPPLSLSITFVPLAPSIAGTTAPGTVVAHVDARWSDGTPFTGSLTFGPPYGNDGGRFALSGRDVIVNPSGAGLSDVVGTARQITLQTQ